MRPSTIGMLMLAGAAAVAALAAGSDDAAASTTPIRVRVHHITPQEPTDPHSVGYRRAHGMPAENPYYPPGLLGHRWRSWAELPDDASAERTDRYGQRRWQAPGASYWVDEYGRPSVGEGTTLGQIAKAFAAGGDGLADAFADAKGVLKDVTGSPLWSLAMHASAMVPGIGTAVSVGMAAAYAYGHDVSLSDAALSAARAAVPGGIAGQTAFDLGIALASGQSASDAALAAARERLPPEARAAYDVAITIGTGRELDARTRDEAAGAAAAEIDRYA